MPKRSSKADLNTRAFKIVGIATGQINPDENKNPAAVALGRLGGKKGGAARAKALSPEKRAEIARLAAAARWKKS